MPISESFRSKMRKSATVTCVSSVALAGFMFSVPVANAAEYQNDSAWGTAGQITLTENQTRVYEPGLDSSNNLYVISNEQSTEASTVPQGITKYNSAGAIDTTWGASGFVALDGVKDIHVLNDGTTYAITDTIIKVYNPDSTEKASYDISNASTALTGPAETRALAVSVTGTNEIIFAIGTQLDFTDTTLVYKLDANGNFVSTFGTEGYLNLGNQTATDIAVASDGNIYVASDAGLYKYSEDGVYDEEYAPVVNGEVVYDLQASPTDSSIYAKTASALLKLSPAGVQEEWNDGDGFARSDSLSFALSAAGDLYVANQSQPSYTKLIVSAALSAPSAPNNFAASNVADRTATVSWEAPTNNGGSEITGYDIQYRVVGSTDWLLLDQPATARTANLSGLNPETGYEVSITATNGSGVGAAASLLLNTTPVAEGVSAPSALSVVSEQSGQARLTWAVPAQPEGVTITGYEVQYRLDGGDTAATTRTVAADITEYSATDLENLSKYNFSVRTLTSDDASDFSPSVVITPFEFAPVANYTDTREEAGVQQVPGSTIQLTPSNVNDLLPVGATVNLKLVNSAGAERLIGSQIVGADGGYDLTGTIPVDYATGNATLLAEVEYENTVRQAVEESLVIVAAESAPNPNAPVVGSSGDNGNVVPADNGTIAPTYANCDAAIADNNGNLKTTDRNLDGDGDGIGCEVAGGPQNASALAYTGSDGTSSLIGAGLLLLGAGAGLGAISLKRRKKYESFLPSNIS